MMQRRELNVGSFVFESGKTLDSLHIVYHTSDREYTPGDKVIWICHALTANSDPEDWWPQMVGTGKLFDPDRYYVVCANMLGSPYGSSGPSSLNPESGRPYLLDFPETTVRDIVNANILVRKALGINNISLMIGPSIGGFQLMEWTIMEPDIISQAVILATTYRAHAYLTAFNESQRMAILADRSFLEAKSLEGGREGLKCARSIALISYRTFEGYNATQYESDEDTMFAQRACSYQRYQGEKLVSRSFDAYSYWYLTRSLDSHNVGRGRGGVEKALSGVKARCTVVSIATDCLFPPELGKEIASMIKGASYHEINSIYGHDGFLIENDQLVAILNPLMESL